MAEPRPYSVVMREEASAFAAWALQAPRVVTLVAAFAPPAAGLWLLGKQVLSYLRDGNWIPLPIFDLMANTLQPAAAALLGLGPDAGSGTMGGLSAWLRSPSGWLGLHSIISAVLKALSTPTVLLLLGIASIPIGLRVASSINRLRGRLGAFPPSVPAGGAT